MALSPSEIILEIYNFIKDVAKSGETSIKSLIISLLVYAMKEFFKQNIFVCPIQHYTVYGNLFIFGPAVVLFCISLLVSETFWHLTTGVCCCRRVIWWKSRKSVYLATLPPLVWLILVFADAHYYVCSKIGPTKIAMAAANSTAAKNALELKISNARSESQIVSWALFISVVILATIVLTIDRCISKPGSNVAEFEKLETSYALDMFKKRIKPLAESQAKNVIDELFEHHKDKKPNEMVERVEEYLLDRYPNFGGPRSEPCCAKDKKENEKSPTLKGLFSSRGKKDEDVEVKLTESSGHQQYTSIN